MQTAGADVLPPSMAGAANTHCKCRAWREEGKGACIGQAVKCRVQWQFLVVCWFNFAQEMSKREGKQPPPESRVVPGRWYRKGAESPALPPTGRDVRHWHAGKRLK